LKHKWEEKEIISISKQTNTTSVQGKENAQINVLVEEVHTATAPK
jgi:hypothetical protein